MKFGFGPKLGLSFSWKRLIGFSGLEILYRKVLVFQLPKKVSIGR